ncbi:MAG: hypothetical protein AB7O62_05050 [Pirellulales bacterium]
MLPELLSTGDLPDGVHRATLEDVIERFGTTTPQRRIVAERLTRIVGIAEATECLERFVIFGSFVTAKPDPDDVDIFMIMDDRFSAASLSRDVGILFDHGAAQAVFGASVFWMRRLATMGNEQGTVEYWQVTRGPGSRGIVEIILEAP